MLHPLQIVYSARLFIINLTLLCAPLVPFLVHIASPSMLMYIKYDNESVLYSIGCEDGIMCHVILKPTTLGKNAKFPNFSVSFTV
jgi:hypothetical protein